MRRARIASLSHRAPELPHRFLVLGAHFGPCSFEQRLMRQDKRRGGRGEIALSIFVRGNAAHRRDGLGG